MITKRAADPDPERVLLLASRDDEALLGASGLSTHACADVRELAQEIARGAGALLLSEERLEPNVAPLLEALRAQPSWSDLPIVLLTRAGACEPPDALARRGNVTALERPVSVATVQSALRSAVRARRRQYELRDKLAELQRSDERSRLVMEAVSESVWDVDIASGRTWISESMLSLFGYMQRESKPHEDAWRERQHPDDRARVAEAFQRVLAEGGSDWTVEYRLRKGDGTYAHVLDRARILRDASGAPVRIVGATLDISERKQDEEARARLAAIVESSDDAIVSKTLDGTILTWNSGAERIFGYSAEEAIGKPITMIIPPERHGEEAAILARIARGQRLEHFETVRRHKSGRELYVSLTVSPVHDAAGRIIGASKVARDVTARRIAEETLRKQSDRLRLLWESASVLLTSEDPDAMMRALFGRIAPHLQLDAYLNFVPTENGDALVLHSYAGIGEEQARSIRRMDASRGPAGAAAQLREQIVASHVQQSDDPKLEMIRRCGVRAYFCSPLVADGRLLGTLSFGSRQRDAFDPEEIEFLQTISRYVTLACERAGLVRHLRDTDRRKDEFLATLAHELRNPLAPIRNALQIMSLAESGAAVEQARGMMDRQLGQMVRLIDDLLDVSRITMGRLELRKERVDIESVLASAVETARPLIDACGHTLRVALPPSPVYLDADPVRLAQIFSNLLNNAAKYMDRGGRIDVEARRGDDELRVTVRDTGRGIPSDALPNVFELFAQFDRSAEHGHGGLGIGLTLVKRLVELHGGRVEAHSDGLGRGTEMIVVLPAAPVQVQAQAPAAPATARRPLRTHAFAFRILVADDNVDAADSLALMLRMMGNQVRSVHDGAQAIEEAEAFRPDLSLLDIGMPHVSGYEVARRIRAQRWGARMVLVALTGWGQDEDKRLAREAGFDHHFTKPVNPTDLEKLLAELTGEPRPPGRVPRA